MAKLAPAKKKFLFKTLIFMLGFLSMSLIAYLVFLPFYPLIKYQFIRAEFENSQNENIISAGQSHGKLPSLSGLKTAAPEITQPDNQTNIKAVGVKAPAKAVADSVNRLIIKKIGVSVPIVEAPEAKWQAALNKGAWRLPQSSTPDQGSNTVISGHRYKYLPPNNLTFYLLDKLTAGDIINVTWENKEYDYQVKESKIVPPTEISILRPTDRPTLTLFTCDPIWSTKNRLVVVAELIP